ncbi:MAG: hemerythrin domain-containing protein [Polyangiales bacterium]
MTVHIEDVTSKVMGKAKLAKGAIEGLSGIFTTLMEEHGQVGALLSRLKNNADIALRRELWPEIRAELLSHEQGELLVLYPVYRAHPEIAHIAVEHEREANQLAPLIEELHALDVADPRWGERFDLLAQRVHDHVKDEEVDFFREGNRVFGSQNKALDEQYKLTKQRVRDELLR